MIHRSPDSQPFDDSEPIPPSTPSGNSKNREPSPGSEPLFEHTDHPALDAMSELSDIRQDRVTAIQHAIESGTYSIPAEKLAEKLIHDISISTPEDPHPLP